MIVFSPVFFLSPPQRDLDCLGVKNRTPVLLPVEEVLQTLNDLIAYFQLPDVELEHEERQIKLRSLKNRQNLFKQEVSFTKKEQLSKQGAHENVIVNIKNFTTVQQSNDKKLSQRQVTHIGMLFYMKELNALTKFFKHKVWE